jgi:hypothetical protein
VGALGGTIGVGSCVAVLIGVGTRAGGAGTLSPLGRGVPSGIGSKGVGRKDGSIGAVLSTGVTIIGPFSASPVCAICLRRRQQRQQRNIITKLLYSCSIKYGLSERRYVNAN